MNKREEKLNEVVLESDSATGNVSLTTSEQPVDVLTGSGIDALAELASGELYKPTQKAFNGMVACLNGKDIPLDEEPTIDPGE